MIAPEPPRSRVETECDYDLHGLLGIRLLNPKPCDSDAVRRQLGEFRRPLTRDPDIEIHFVERLPAPDLQYREQKKNSFTDDGISILDRSEHSTIARIFMGCFGDPCRITCQSGVGSVPLLVEMIRLTALAKGLVPFHASAFEYGGIGILATGGAHSGKTSALLAFAERGAQYITDDLVLLTGDGRQMYGIPAPIEASDWQLHQLGRARDQVRRSDLLLSKGIGCLNWMQQRLSSGGLGATRPALALRKAVPALRHRLRIKLQPEVLFGEAEHRSEPRKLFLTLTHPGCDIRVEPADPRGVVNWIVNSARRDWLPVLDHHLTHRFAGGDRIRHLIEQAADLHAQRLRRALAEVETYIIRHPRPVSLHSLYDAMRPFCEPPSAASPTGGEYLECHR